MVEKYCWRSWKMVNMGEEMNKNTGLGTDSWQERASTTTFVLQVCKLS